MLIVLIILTIALPLVQIVNILVGVTFDVCVLLGATSQKADDAKKAIRGQGTATLGQFATAARSGLKKRRKERSKPDAKTDAKTDKKPPPPAKLTRRGGSSSLLDKSAKSADPPPALLNRRGGSSQLVETPVNDKVDDLFKTPPSTGIFTSAFQYVLGSFPSRTNSTRAPYDEVSTTTDEDEENTESLIPPQYEYAFRPTDNVV